MDLQPFAFESTSGRIETVDAEFVGDLRVHVSLDDSDLVNVSSPLGFRVASFTDWPTARVAADKIQAQFPGVDWFAGDALAAFGNEATARAAFDFAKELMQ